MKAAFRQPGFTRLYSALSASMLGDSIMLLVLSMWVKTLTGSNGQAGLTFFFMVIPSFFGPLLGVWVDRVRNKPLLVWGNVVSAAMVLPLVLVRDAGDVWLIWLVAFFYGVSFVVLPAALNGLLKDLVAEDVLVEANASLQTTKEAFRLFGPLVGAAVFATVGGWAVALIDAASFVVAAAVIASLVVREEAPEREESHLLQQVAEGVRHLVGDRILGHLVVGFGITLLVIGFCEAAIYALMDGFDKPPTYVGFLVTIQGIGAVVGGLLSSRVIRRLGEVGGCVVGLVLLAVAMLGMSTAPALWIALAWTIPFGAALPVLMVGYMTLLQKRTPRRLMGRVSTAAEVVLATPQSISLAIGSLLVVLLDWRVIFVIMAVVTGIAALYIAVMLRDQLTAAGRSAGAVEEDGDGAVVDGLDVHLGPELTPLDPGAPIG